MPPKRVSQISPSSSTGVPPIPKAPSSTTSNSKLSGNNNSSKASAQEVLLSLWTHYVNTTPQRVKLMDVFMAFLVAVGGLQFVYCVLVGNYPFNAFLSGFSATVGQFVLTASLRIQTNPENKGEFGSVSHER
ncbi:oligosaccharyltransferase complex subunit epsilon [Mycoblastus sanguinarius]|nr:oligosaccharyltransferase complex subunit epsilon [Mycoblastus sanguinarius]